MHRFRRQSLRKLIHLLVVGVLLGNSLTIWATTAQQLGDQDSLPMACNMQDTDDHGCCNDHNDCMKSCTFCVSTTTLSMSFMAPQPGLPFTQRDGVVSRPLIVPDGTTSSQLYRPPILSA